MGRPGCRREGGSDHSDAFERSREPDGETGRQAYSFHQSALEMGDNNAAVATEVEKQFVEIGVRKDLQAVDVDNEEYDGISEDEWNKFSANVQRRDEAAKLSAQAGRS